MLSTPVRVTWFGRGQLGVKLSAGKPYGLASALVASRPLRVREFAREMLTREMPRDGGKEERHAQSG